MVKLPPVPKTNVGSPLTHGRQSKFLKRFGSCDICPIREYCSHKELLNSQQQKRGCEDLRKLFMENIRKWNKPITALIRNAADVRTRISMQQLKDGVENEISSANWHKLMELELKISREIMKYDPNASQQRITVEHKFDPDKEDDVIIMDTEAYESDTIVENKETPHGNLSKDKAKRLQEQG